MGLDRRSRVLLTLDEAVFRSLIETPGLRSRPGGGWVARLEPRTSTGPAPGRPGWVDGTRMVMDPQGRLVEHAANLGEHSQEVARELGIEVPSSRVPGS
jgi:hypothetical protein